MEWPYLTLDIAENTTDEQVRKGYLRCVQACPPEKNAARFAAIQQAYELIRTEEARAELKLFGLPGEDSIAALIPERAELKKNIPMNIWLDELNR